MNTRVLVIDDLEENLYALRQILKREPYAVDTARSAEEGLAMMLRHDYAAVLCDVQMPGMDGLEFIKIVRADPDLEKVPVTFITAHTYAESTLHEAFQHDAFDFMVKPVAPALVRGKCRVFATLYEQRQQLEAQADRVKRDQQRLAALNRQLAQRNESLEQYAYVAAHDLQEPLRRLSVFCDVLEQDYGDVLDDDGKLYIRFIMESAQRMRGLLGDLLRVGRAEGQPPSPQVCALDAVVQHALENVDQYLTTHDAEVEVEPLPEVVTDPELVGQVFQNLISNAIRYRSDAPPRIRISAAERPQAWDIVFQDNGIGIAAEHHEVIFGMFRTLESQPASKARGVGLALCRRILTQLGGSIRVDSELGLGSTFTVTLPRQESP